VNEGEPKMQCSWDARMWRYVTFADSPSHIEPLMRLAEILSQCDAAPSIGAVGVSVTMAVGAIARLTLFGAEVST